MNARAAVAVCVSLALHAGALSYVVYAGLDAPGALAGDPTGASRGVMEGRIIAAPRLAVPTPTPMESSLAMPAPSTGPAAALPPDATDSAPVAVAALTAVPSAAPARAASAAAAATPPQGMDAALARFAPASQLSARPVAVEVGDLEPAWLDQVKGAAVATVSVYVEADGTVFHVELRNASDPRIGEMVRMAFRQARFTPGIAQGRNVAARVDISLDYEQQRERVTNPDRARPAENVLTREQVKPAIRLGEDVPQTNIKPK